LNIKKIREESSNCREIRELKKAILADEFPENLKTYRKIAHTLEINEEIVTSE